jgi:hypothetical protein
MHVQFDGAHAEPQLLRGFGAAGDLTIADKPKQKIAPGNHQSVDRPVVNSRKRWLTRFAVPFEIVWAESDPNATGCAERFLLALLVQAHPNVKTSCSHKKKA